MDSSLTNRDLIDLGWSSRGVCRPRDLETLTAPHDGTGMVDGQSIVRLDVEETQAMFAGIVGRRG